MKYLTSILAVFIVAVVAVILYNAFSSYNPSERNILQDKNVAQPAQSGKDQWEMKTDEQPPVTVKVTPIEFGNNTNAWRFALVFDTHSGSLDDDVLAVAALADDRGNIYKPTAWEGSGPGGHHREGVLIFNAVSPLPLSAELKIQGVGGVPERSFKWNIE